MRTPLRGQAGGKGRGPTGTWQFLVLNLKRLELTKCDFLLHIKKALAGPRVFPRDPTQSPTEQGAGGMRSCEETVLPEQGRPLQQPGRPGTWPHPDSQPSPGLRVSRCVSCVPQKPRD